MSEGAEKFRAALLSASEGDGMASRLALGSLLASAQDDPELQQVVRDTFTACDEPIVKRAADWGRELADYERALRERIAAEIETLATEAVRGRPGYAVGNATFNEGIERAARLVRRGEQQ